MKTRPHFIIGLAAALAVGYTAGVYTGMHNSERTSPLPTVRVDKAHSAELALLRAGLNKLRVQYTDEHPKVRDAQQRLQATEQITANAR